MDARVAAALRQILDTAERRGLTLVSVESCTAGALASALAKGVGAGRVLHGGFVAYSKAQKIALGVPEPLLADYSPVSRPVVEAMARAAFRHSPADLSLAVTGVAGSEPDEDGNPVGLVYVAAAWRCGDAAVERHDFTGDRESICQAAVISVLKLAVGLVHQEASRV